MKILKKKIWLLALGIVVMEGLSWAMLNTKVWPLAVATAFAGFVFCGLLFTAMLKTQQSVVTKWIVCTLCVSLIAGHLYGWLWLRSGFLMMIPDARVIEVGKIASDNCHVKLSVTMSDGRKEEYDVIFKKEDAVLLAPDSDKSYDILVKYHGCWPHCTTGKSVKEHSTS